MKKLTRIGVIVLMVGVLLLFVTVFRGISSTSLGSFNEDSPPDQWTLQPNFLLPPRDLRVEIEASQTVDLYVLDAEGVRLWEASGTLKPIWAFEGVKQETYTLQIEKRGGHSLLTHNNQSSPTAIKTSLTLYGFERDIQWGSIAFIIIGIVIVVASLLIRKPKNNTPLRTKDI